MNIDITLATACYDLTKYYPKSRSLKDNIENMRPLLEVPTYLVIFCDQNTYPLIYEIRNQKNDLGHFTHYLIDDFEKIEFFKYNELVKQHRLRYHPSKDERTCSESHILCCNKFNFVLQIMNLNPFHTKKFGWIDANVQENFKKISQNYKNHMLLNVLKNTTEKYHIQILNVCDKKYKNTENKREYYSRYQWVICGCLFTTGVEIGRKILNRLNEIFIETTKMGYGHSEEMLYLEVLDEFYDDFEKGYGDYHHILNNFIKPTTGLSYIHMIIKKYLDFSYHRECYDACKKVLQSIENYEIEIDYPIYFSILFSYYVSSFYHKYHEAKQIVEHIQKLIQVNPHIRKEYLKNKNFYQSQFSFAK